MKQLRLWLLGLFALCGIAAVAQEAKADSTGYIVKGADGSRFYRNADGRQNR